MKRTQWHDRLCWAVTVATALVAVSTARGAIISWDNSSGNMNWGQPTNWVGDVLPTAADTARFTDTGSDTIPGSPTVELDTSRTLSGLRLENTAGRFQTIDLNSHTLTVLGDVNLNTNVLAGNTQFTAQGGELTLGSAAVRPDLIVSRMALQSDFDIRVTADLRGVVLNAELDELIVAERGMGGAGTSVGTVLGGTGGTMQIGEPGQLGRIVIGRTTSSGTGTGTVDLSAMTSFTADVSELLLGTNQTGGTALGRLSLPATSTISANTVRIGSVATNAVVGTESYLQLGNSTSLVADSMLVGGDLADAAVRMPSGGSFQLGSALRPTDLAVGQTRSSTDHSIAGRMELNGGLWSATLSNLSVGERKAGGAGTTTGLLTGPVAGDLVIGSPAIPGQLIVGRATSGGAVTGVLDLSGMDTLNANLTQMLVATNLTAGTAVGQVSLAESNFISADSIVIGSAAANPSVNAESYVRLGQANTILADSVFVGGDLVNGALLAPIGSHLELGSEDQPVALTVGRTLRGTDFEMQGRMDLTGATADLVLSDLTVGTRLNGAGRTTGTISGAVGGTVVIGSAETPAQVTIGSVNNGGNAVGTVDLSGMHSLTAHLSALSLGLAVQSTSSRGTLLLPETSTIEAGQVMISQSTINANGTAVSRITGGALTNLQTPLLTVGGSLGSGLLDVAANGVFNLGTEESLADVYVAHNNVFSDESTNGAIDMSAGTWNAWIDQMVVGEKTSGGLGTALGSVISGSDGVINANRILIGAGSGDGIFTLLGGTLNVHSLERGLGSATFNFLGGELHADQIGTDELPWDLSNGGAGTLSPGNSPGMTRVTGNYVQSSSGTLAIELGGLDPVSEFDVLSVDQLSLLGGILQVSLIEGFVPELGDAFEFLRGAMVAGEFDQVLLPSLPNSLAWHLSYAPDAVSLNVIELLIGDANGDGFVGAADYALWAAQFGQTGAGLSADFDGNGSVGAGDYALWAANFGSSATPPGGAAMNAGSQSVPEPSSLALAGLGAVLGLGCLGRRCQVRARQIARC